MTTGREKTLPNGKCIDGKEMFTDRSGWWRNTIKDYPIPGSYHIRDFIEEIELNPVSRTYGFKGPKRNTLMSIVHRGDVLLPGAYNFTDSTNEVLQRRATYSFKSCPRPDIHTLGLRDKDINLSPGHYDVTEKPVPKSPCKHVMFRSAVQRVSFLPGNVELAGRPIEEGRNGMMPLKPSEVDLMGKQAEGSKLPAASINTSGMKEGPAPGHYNPRQSTGIAVTSCFKSTVPRLYNVHSGTPGPGVYEPTWHKGQRLSTDVKVDWAHDLLFRNIP